MRAALVFCLLGLAGCAGSPGPVVTAHESGGSRADGIVTMTSTRFLYNPVQPNDAVTARSADKRCRAWGHDGAAYFAGDQEACEIYDFYGRCARSAVTRFYSCSD